MFGNSESVEIADVLITGRHIRGLQEGITHTC